MWYIERTINKDIYYWKQNTFNTLWGLFDGYWTKDPNSRYLFKDFRKAEKFRNKLHILGIHIKIRYLRNY